MPNAAASLDADFAPRTPGRRRPTQAASRKKGRKPSLARRVAMLDKVPRYGAIAISALIGVGIVVNALMMQHGNHPAPLFGSAVPPRAIAKLAPAKAAPVKPEAVKPDANDEAADPPAVAAVAAVAAPEAAGRAAMHPSKAGRGDDPIARLLGAGAAGAAPHRAKLASEKAPVQKAAKASPEKHRKGDD